jgi:hypothetical protein
LLFGAGANVGGTDILEAKFALDGFCDEGRLHPHPLGIVVVRARRLPTNTVGVAQKKVRLYVNAQHFAESREGERGTQPGWETVSAHLQLVYTAPHFAVTTEYKSMIGILCAPTTALAMMFMSSTTVLPRVRSGMYGVVVMYLQRDVE